MQVNIEIIGWKIAIINNLLLWSSSLSNFRDIFFNHIMELHDLEGLHLILSFGCLWLISFFLIMFAIQKYFPFQFNYDGRTTFFYIFYRSFKKTNIKTHGLNIWMRQGTCSHNFLFDEKLWQSNQFYKYRIQLNLITHYVYLWHHENAVLYNS